MPSIVVSALYHFARLDNFEEMRTPLQKVMQDNDVKGTLLIASEGINGTVAGTRLGIDALHAHIRSDPRLKDIVSKESYHDDMPFHRTKVKLKQEIVTMGVEGIDPNNIVGTYVKPEDWNDLISTPDVILVDTRNDYEVAIGSFKGALNPEINSFREFPKYAEENLSDAKDKKVAMFCTGGIRCEKSTAYLKQQGFKDVFHLEGGILKYLEKIPKNDSLWEGECFVFDGRIAVKHDLEKGQYDQCYACRMPITEDDKLHAQYVKGISCHHCFDKKTPEQKKRYANREKQVALAAKTGAKHIGGDVLEIIERRRTLKNLEKQHQKIPLNDLD